MEQPGTNRSVGRPSSHPARRAGSTSRSGSWQGNGCFDSRLLVLFLRHPQIRLMLADVLTCPSR